MTKKCNNSGNCSRRSFIRYASSTALVGLSRSPIVALFNTILGGQSQQAWAQSLGLQPRSWVQIHENAGPARYMCDSFLTPYASGGFNKNPMIGTRFKNVGGRYIGVDYETIERYGVQVPTMWGYDLPTSSGGTRPMADMLQNLLSIQGVTTRNAGHGGSSLWSFLSPGAKKSTTAMSADASNAPFAAINLQANGYVFRSTQNKSSLGFSQNGNLITRLLDPFRPVGSTSFRINRSTIKQAYDSLLPALDELARAGHPGADALVQNRNSTLNLVEYNFANIDTEWAALLSKYTNLINKAIFDPANPLVGVNDLPIGEGGSGAVGLYKLSEAGGLALHLATDIRSAIDSRTTLPGAAACFAFTEYVLKNKLSSSIAFGTGQIGPFIRQSDGVASESMTNDQHSVGLYPSLYFNLLRYRAIYACLLELTDQLKTANLFNDTVISLAGDFNRNPRTDLLGSDHGFTGKSYALYSGAFNGPLIIGNLKNDSRMGWGAGAITPELGRQINLVDTAVTFAHLIGVPPPFTSALPLVTLGSNGLVSNIGTTRHI